MMISARKTLLTVLAAAAALVLMASAAFACLDQKGSITLTPSGGTAGDTVTGTGTGMNWCAWPANAASVAQGGSVTVAVQSGACPGKASTQLDQATYEVRLNDDTTSPSWKYVDGTWQFQSGTGCWVADGVKTLDTTYDVDASGSGSESVTIPSNANPSDADEAAGLCVGKSGGPGIFAPLRIT